jgi:hypothetical protein
MCRKTEMSTVFAGGHWQHSHPGERPEGAIIRATKVRSRESLSASKS